MEKKNKVLRILNIVPNMRAAGIETFIMNVYRNIDRTKIQFDFLVHSQERQFYDDEIEQLGGKIFRLTYKDDKNFIKYIKDLNTFFKQHKEYNIVHGHMQSMLPVYLMIAKRNNVNIRIAHSHNNSYEKSFKGFILHIISRFTKYYSTNNFACSCDSGRYMFGKKIFEVVSNGINVDNFKFNKKIRDKYRDDLNLNDKFVIGHVGRFEKQKNHDFLIDIFANIVEQKENSVLLLIGEGKTKKKIKEKIDDLNLTDKVIFLGIRDDINNLMQSMDVFVLPSLYEGLGIVLIEAQSAGLNCFTTKDKVAKETNVSDNIKYIQLNNNSEEWAKEILSSKNNERSNDINMIKKDFDIKNVAHNLEIKYFNLLNGGDK